MASKRVVEFLAFSMLYSIVLVEGQQVPCLFIFGDSGSDNGNNNALAALSKSNYLPYGIDYPDGPTGRFSNGKIIPDFLAEHLGFDKPIPPFATANGAEILKGVNYASGAGGILDQTGAMQGHRIPMNQQLANHGATISKIGNLMGNTSKAREHLNKCLYYAYMGNNDYVNNYLLPLYPSSRLYTPQQFATLLINHYSQQLRSLYNYGARKIVVFGLGLIRCALEERPVGSICNDSDNLIAGPFNDRLKLLIDVLNADLDAAQLIFIDSNSIFQGDNSTLGIKVKSAPCCTASSITGLCESGKEICSNRSEYLFWDDFHLSEIGHRIVAARSYKSKLPTDAYPMDIRRLVQQ